MMTTQCRYLNLQAAGTVFFDYLLKGYKYCVYKSLHSHNLTSFTVLHRIYIKIVIFHLSDRRRS